MKRVVAAVAAATDDDDEKYYQHVKIIPKRDHRFTQTA